jgi:hypothetical protein
MIRRPVRIRQFNRNTRNRNVGLLSAFILVAVSLQVAGVNAIGASGTTTTTPEAPSVSTTIPSGGTDLTVGGGGTAYWGWDELTQINGTTLASYESLLGTPTVIGQYLDHGGGPVLTSASVSLFHGHGIKINLLMANDQVYGNGTTDANLAAGQAVALGAPANGTVAIYRDIEPSDNPSPSYLNAWYNELLVRHFVPGFYENPLGGHPFGVDFCGSNSSTISGTLLWSQQPQQSGSPSYPASFKLSAAPKTWYPNYPSCTIGNTTNAWQYQITTGTTSKVDVDLTSITGAW